MCFDGSIRRRSPEKLADFKVITLQQSEGKKSKRAWANTKSLKNV